MTNVPFYRARKRLPEGFQYVSIGNRQIQILRQMGIDYIEGTAAAGPSRQTRRPLRARDFDEEDDIDDDE